MITLKIKTKIPKTRHLRLDLDLPATIAPGEAEIVMVFNNLQDNKKKLQRMHNKQLQKKLLTFSMWNEDDFSEFKSFREEMNKWKPEEY